MLVACAYAFLGGENRIANVGEIGVHQFFDPSGLKSQAPIFSADDLASQQILLSTLLTYVTEMGVSSSFLKTASDTPASGLHYFTSAELSTQDITLDAAMVKHWKLDQHGTGLVMYADAPDGAHSIVFSAEETGYTPSSLCGTRTCRLLGIKTRHKTIFRT
jgi:hypothetical protein